MSEYEFKELKEEFFPDLLPLFKAAYGHTPSLDELKNKYRTKLWLEENLGVVCYCDNEAVAFVGAVPCILKKGSESLKAAQIGDVMTHPGHLRYGLFHKTGKKLFDRLEMLGVDVIFGFPNLNSKPGFKKRLGWIFTDELKVSIIDVKCLPFIRLTSLLPFLRKPISRFQRNYFERKSIDPVPFISCLGEDFFEVRKDVDYLKYKLKHKESFILKLKGKVVWVKFEKMYLYVGNIESCDFATFTSIIDELKRICLITGIPHIRFNVSDGSLMKSFVDKITNEDTKSFAVGGLIFKEGISFNQLKFSMSDNDTF